MRPFRQIFRFVGKATSEWPHALLESRFLVPSHGTIPELPHVAKVTEQMLWNSNLKQSIGTSALLNQRCLLALDF
jgi:hypothetical protein